MNSGTIFTVRNSLFAITAVLMLGMVIMSGIGAFDAMQTRNAENEVVAANVISDNLLTSANNWAVERGVTNANLAGDNPVSQKARTTIDARRAKADPAFQKALEGLKDFRDFAGKKELIADATSAYEKAVAMRKVAETTSNVDQAVELCGRECPDFILMDLVMPDCDGFELLDALSKQSISSKIIIMSGFDGRYLKIGQHFAEARGLSVFGLIRKPFRLHDLTGLLQEGFDITVHEKAS